MGGERDGKEGDQCGGHRRETVHVVLVASGVGNDEAVRSRRTASHGWLLRPSTRRDVWLAGDQCFLHANDWDSHSHGWQD
ncbi:hypothetical protein GWL_28020 [Herbaspirillum sp. GW103]|nr:hypothetical protein GWL_28020 [Herbaspirillum sp. GW103]